MSALANEVSEQVSTQSIGMNSNIGKAPYLSREFLEGEKARLRPNVWLMACRENEVAEKGRFVTFNIADESIEVVRYVSLR